MRRPGYFGRWGSRVHRKPDAERRDVNGVVRERSLDDPIESVTEYNERKAVIPGPGGEALKAFIDFDNAKKVIEIGLAYARARHLAVQALA